MRSALLLTGAGAASAYTIVTAGAFMEKNIDPIVVPGQYTSHLHTFFGSDAVTANTTTSKELQAGCSTAENPNDYSSYWTPTLVKKNEDGSVQRVPFSRFSAYYVSIENAEIAIPQDFRNVVGNASATSQEDVPALAGHSWFCEGSESGEKDPSAFPTVTCKTHLQTLLLFHDCVNPDTLESDYSGTQHWTETSKPANRCPAGMKRIPQLRFSIRYDLRKILPDGWTGPPPLELACGNSYCFHGDFINGWLPEAAENMLLANAKREFAGVDGPNGAYNAGSLCPFEEAKDQDPEHGVSDYLESQDVLKNLKSADAAVVKPETEAANDDDDFEIVEPIADARLAGKGRLNVPERGLAQHVSEQTKNVTLEHVCGEAILKRQFLFLLAMYSRLMCRRYVNSLLETIRENGGQAKHDDGDTLLGDASSTLAEPVSTTLDNAGREIRKSTENAEEELNDPSSASRAELASGPAFESRARSILREHAVASSPRNSLGASWRSTEDHRTQDHMWDTGSLVQDMTPSPILTKAESLRLFNEFVSLLGINQHFLDPRKFADALDLFYESESTRLAHMQSLWFTQYLLVMAMGMLHASRTDDPDRLPGSTFFAEAMRRLPPTYELGQYGTTSVEILSLVALYLQWSDRKHDAYLYIGLAVRLAVAFGCALPREEQTGVSSEKCHRNRLWWTLYMLDRRLSAALGLPMSVDERQIRADLPKPQAGFLSPLPITINVHIARATGEIMTSFYGNVAISQAELVKRIQNMLQSLYEIGRSIPEKIVTDFDNPTAKGGRTQASLHLMLFQAIILCVRPIILQTVKEKVEALNGHRSPPVLSPTIKRLCQSGREAAAKSIRILSKLHDERTRFGYFDLDATFSAAFILVMFGFLDSKGDQVPPEGVRESARILRYLSKGGNRAAQRRLSELMQFCQHVWVPDPASEEWKWLSIEVTTAPSGPSTSDQSGDPGSAGGLEQFRLMPDNYDGRAQLADLSTWTPAQGSSTLDLNQFEDIDWNLEPDMRDIYESFNDPNLPLTGIDDADWATIGRMFNLGGE
ncbi:Proline utilization trans-activator [Paramyrothecium foliicola]|nr:Proline utilization trans-activator [Paramyrothecium foliicola]